VVAIGAAAVASAAFWRAVSSLGASLGALGETIDTPSRRDVELYGKVRLPPNVRDLRARVQTFASKRKLLARFSIAPGELPDLLASGGFGELSAGPIPVELSVPGKPDWWTPEAARSYLTGAAERGAILVEKDGPDRYVIYLVRFS
jgi:hypothetical protein